MTRARLLVLASMLAGACVVVGLAGRGDWMLPAEVAAVVTIGAWLAMTLRRVWLGLRLGRALRSCAVSVEIEGVPCELVKGGGAVAFVIGGLRPRIYVGGLLLARLDGDELRAVALHEEYHRRTQAPLRSAALEGWMRLIGMWQPCREALESRLADLELQADRYAMRNGASAAAIAGALLKVEPVCPGQGFAASAHVRVRSLLSAADVEEGTATHVSLPLEWLPVAAIATVIVGCHLLWV